MQSHAVDFSRKWYVMAAVGMSLFLATIDGSIVNVAVPNLQTSFQADFAAVQWVVLVYLLAMATLMLSMGRLGDMLGKKSLFVAGFVVFTVGSVLCGLSPTIGWLIGFRVIQAVGAAMLLALGAGILTEAFPPHERGMALGFSGTVVSVGIVTGPTLGGFLLDVLSWHWIFFVNLPVGIIGTIMAWHFVPDIKPAGRQRFDFLGAATLFFGLLLALLALTIGQNWGFGDARILGMMAASMMLLAIFVFVEGRVRHPMLDLSLFSNELLRINLLTGLTTFISIAGTMYLMPFYLGNMLELPPRMVGLLLSVFPVIMGFIAPLAGRLSDRYGPRLMTTIGMAVLALGYFLISTLRETTTIPVFVMMFIPIGIGMGMFQSPNNSAVMGVAPPDKLGVVSGLLSVTRTLGQVLGIALLGAIWAIRVEARAGAGFADDPTLAPVAAQVGGLNDVSLFVLVVILMGLAGTVWGLIREQRIRKMVVPEPLTLTGDK